MKNLALGALALVVGGVLAACGGGGGVKLIDGGGDAAMACNPIAQSGCKAAEKCTWIVDIDGTATADEVGHVGCTADGTVANGDACADASVASGGVDKCVAGSLCIAGKCKFVCDPQLVDGSAPGACAVNFSCSIYSGVFAAASAPIAGVCEPGCDPLTQALKVGTTGTAACGSVDPLKPTGTCVASAGFKSFHCAPTGMSIYAKTDRQPPLAAPDGTPFGNGCAPGFLPFYFENANGGMKTLCSGMCAPAKVDMTIAGMAGNTKLNEGDATAMGKLPTEAVAVGKSTCAVGVKGSDPNGEDCRYIWFPLADGKPASAITTPYNDTLGICFAFSNFITIDINDPPDGKPDLPEKSCAKLPVTADAKDPFGSAKENGCYPLADSMAVSAGPATSQQNAHRFGSFRLGNGAGAAARHIFE